MRVPCASNFELTLFLTTRQNDQFENVQAVKTSLLFEEGMPAELLFDRGYFSFDVLYEYVFAYTNMCLDAQFAFLRFDVLCLFAFRPNIY